MSILITTNHNVEYCDQCPYHNSTKVYTGDSFEDVRKIYCSELKKDIYKFLDYPDKAVIPEDCPYVK